MRWYLLLASTHKYIHEETNSLLYINDGLHPPSAISWQVDVFKETNRFSQDETP